MSIDPSRRGISDAQTMTSERCLGTMTTSLCNGRGKIALRFFKFMLAGYKPTASCQARILGDLASTLRAVKPRTRAAYVHRQLIRQCTPDSPRPTGSRHWRACSRSSVSATSGASSFTRCNRGAADGSVACASVVTCGLLRLSCARASSSAGRRRCFRHYRRKTLDTLSDIESPLRIRRQWVRSAADVYDIVGDRVQSRPPTLRAHRCAPALRWISLHVPHLRGGTSAVHRKTCFLWGTWRTPIRHKAARCTACRTIGARCGGTWSKEAPARRRYWPRPQPSLELTLLVRNKAPSSRHVCTLAAG